MPPHLLSRLSMSLWLRDQNFPFSVILSKNTMRSKHLKIFNQAYIPIFIGPTSILLSHPQTSQSTLFTEHQLIYNTILLSMDAVTVLISHWHDYSLGTIDLLINF